MNIIINTFCVTLTTLFMLSWTSLLWNITGNKMFTMWYWIAYFGGGLN